VSLAYSRNYTTESKSKIRDIRVHIYDFFVAGLWALKWAWQTFFRTVGATVLGSFLGVRVGVALG